MKKSIYFLYFGFKLKISYQDCFLILNGTDPIIYGPPRARRIAKNAKKCILWAIYEKLVAIFTSPPEGVRGIVFSPGLSVCVSVCLSVCVSVCPANILVFYFSAIRRDIDLKCIQHTYRVVINSPIFIGQRSRSQGWYIAFWRYNHITKTEP